MKTDYTDITVILDRSGSMQNIAMDMEGGFNKFIEDQKKVPGVCKVSLTQFDTGNIEPVYTALDVADVPPLKLTPRGGTPLLDAIGQTVTKTGARLRAMPEKNRPGRVLVLILTDGQENSSRVFSKAQVKALIEEQQGKYNWAFVYLGANVDAFFEAGSLGISLNTVSAYAANQQGVGNSWQNMSQNTTSYRGLAPDKAIRGLTFSDAQRQGNTAGLTP